MEPGAAAALAAASAFVAEFVFYIDPHRFTQGWPAHVKEWSYWIPVVIGMLIAAGLGYLFASDQPIQWYVAMNIGVSWRLIVTEAAKRSPEPRATNVN